MPHTPTFRMRTKDGTTYTLDATGAVLDRSDGPAGWDYFGRWIVLGFGTRFLSRSIVSLDAAAHGADTGQGWVHDLDHGTHRVWAHPRGRRLASIAKIGG